MTMFTYTEDPPYEDPADNKKAYYRLPRRILLAPYLETNPYFTQLCDAVDEVFDNTIEDKTLALQQLRDMWATGKRTEEVIKEGKMIDFTEWGGVDHATNVQQVNNLGLSLSTAEAVDDLSYRALSKFVGSYWFGKGKNTAVDFLNFCLGTNVKVVPLWTQNYIDFYAYPGDSESFIFNTARVPSTEFYPRIAHSVVGGWDVPGYASGVGSPLQQYFAASTTPEAPAWYPTTHVELTVPKDTLVPTDVLGRLFYEVANYNLVIQRITVEASYTTIITEGDTAANLLGIGHIADTAVTPSSSWHPIAYHNKVGGTTGGMGSPLRHISDIEWFS